MIGLLDPTFTKLGWDGWERRFRDLVARSIDPSPGLLVGCTLVEIQGQAVCSVTVGASRYDEAYFLQAEDGHSTYYVRQGPAVVALEGSDMVRHWKDLQHGEPSSKASPAAATKISSKVRG